MREAHYRKSYLEEMNVNEYSNYSAFIPVIEHQNTIKHALVNEKGRAIVLLFALEYSPTKYTCFLLASGELLKACHASEIKSFVKSKYISYNMSRLETLSVDCRLLNRWHKFLGFKLEGTKRKFIGDVDYNFWGMI